MDWLVALEAPAMGHRTTKIRIRLARQHAMGLRNVELKRVK